MAVLPGARHGDDVRLRGEPLRGLLRLGRIIDKRVRPWPDISGSAPDEDQIEESMTHLGRGGGWSWMPTRAGSEPPRILDVFDDGRCTVLEQHCHRVEAVEIVGTTVSSDPRARHPLDLALFGAGHRLERMAVALARTGLHFDEGDQPSPSDHEIDLFVAPPMVPCNHSPAASCQHCGRDRLTAPAQLVGCAHGCQGSIGHSGTPWQDGPTWGRQTLERLECTPLHRAAAHRDTTPQQVHAATPLRTTRAATG